MHVNPPESNQYNCKGDHDEDANEKMASKIGGKIESALHVYYKKAILNLREKVEKLSRSHEKEKRNRTYCPRFFSFIEELLPEMPLWSSVLLGSLDRYIKDPESIPSAPGHDKRYMSYLTANNKSEGHVEGAM